MAIVELTLIGKDGCHLCDDARAVITGVLAEPQFVQGGHELRLTERSILDDDELFERYVEEIPVLLINDRVHNYWRIDPVRLRNALTEVTTA